MPSYKNNLAFLIYIIMKYLKRFEGHDLEYIQNRYKDGNFNGIRVDWHKFQVAFILGCFKLFCKDGENGKNMGLL